MFRGRVLCRSVPRSNSAHYSHRDPGSAVEHGGYRDLYNHPSRSRILIPFDQTSNLCASRIGSLAAPDPGVYFGRAKEVLEPAIRCFRALVSGCVK